MPGSLVLDVLLVLLFIGYLAYGYRSGLVRNIASIAGIIGGGAIAIVLIPLMNTWIPEPGWRIAATIAVSLILLFGGHAVGAAIGGAIQGTVKPKGLRAINRVLGSLASGVIAALVVSTLAFSVGSLGIPVLSPAIGTSTVLRTIDSWTPDPAKRVLAQLRNLVTQEGPRLVEALGVPLTPPTLPDTDTGTPALAAAAQSVVRITGNAYSCGQSQSGSGFVVATDRVVTNAHVVAGVTEPVVEVPGKGAVPGRIVYFDPAVDLAVIAVDSLDARPLTLGSTLPAGSTGVTDGYPFGGPFVSQPARVISLDTVTTNDIYGDNPTSRQIYNLASDVQQGDSGGPLLSETGEVAGVVFAKSSETANIGYAITMEELAPVAASVSGLTTPVSSGDCIRI